MLLLQIATILFTIGATLLVADRQILKIKRNYGRAKS